jgi:hypothetical protein
VKGKIMKKENKIEIESIVKLAFQHMSKYSDLLIYVISGDEIKAKEAYEEAKAQLTLSRNAISEVLNPWPSGIYLVKEWQNMVGLIFILLNIDYEMGKCNHSTSIDLREKRDRIGDLFNRRVKLLEEIDKLLYKHIRASLSYLGIDINEITHDWLPGN